MRMRLSEAAAVTGGTVHGGDVEFAGLSTDSRTCAPGELFVTLHGPNHDGHDFLPAAHSRGAAAALAEHGPAPLPLLAVANARVAMGRLAASWRARHDVDVVGVTGSNGKTTVKEMIAAILAQDAPALATRGNLNNDIGVPLTLARLDATHRRAVVEMGANHPGEIAGLARMAKPRVGVITCIAPAHLEGFGSVEGVARAKGELIAGLPEDGVAVVNADDGAWLDLWRELAGARRMLSFGFTAGAQVRVEHAATAEGARVILHTPAGTIALTLRLPGRHNAANAAAASAAALAMDVPPRCIRAGLEAMGPVHGRLELRAAPGGARILDDSYNANPLSLRAALETLAQFPAPRWLVLGDMGELGDTAAAFHREAGSTARALGVERLLATGPLSRLAVEAFGEGARHFDSREALCRALEGDIRSGIDDGIGAAATVLVKGSRAMGMEAVVAALLEEEAQCC